MIGSERFFALLRMTGRDFDRPPTTTIPLLQFLCFGPRGLLRLASLLYPALLIEERVIEPLKNVI
jgi:hypothetical protein